MQTFDVFDTLLARKVLNPRGIFILMQFHIRNKMDMWELPVYYVDHFQDFRIEAEKECRNHARYHGKEEISIQQIYDVLAYMLGISENVKCKLMELEIQFEIENSLPIAKNIDKLKRAMQYDDVVLISDMYLPTCVIKKMLVNADIIFEEIPLMVSCEYGKTKASGRLFEIFLRQYKVDPANWKHYGDNFVNDGTVVSSFGGEFEIYLPKELYAPGILNSISGFHRPEFEIMAGAIKHIWDEKKSEAFQVGVKWASPVLFGYALWMVKQSVRQKIDHLFFIMRDGYILKKMVDIIIEKFDIHLSTHDLFGSRTAWDMQDYGLVIHSYEDVIKYLRSMGIQEELPIYEAYKNKGKRYSERESVIIKTILESMYMEESAKNDRISRVKSYLQQELSEIHGRIAFVEGNGSGKTQGCLKELCSDFFTQPVQTFYYMISAIIHDYKNNDTLNYRYMYMIPYCRNILEPLTRAPYNRTIDYKYDQNYKRWMPVFCEHSKDYMDQSDFDDYMEGIIQNTAFLCSYKQIMSMDFSEVSRAFLDFICWQPDKQVLNFIGDIPFEGSIQKNGTSVYAPKLDDEELKQLFLYRNVNMMNAYFREANLQFSLLRLTDEQRTMMDRFNRINDGSYKGMNHWIPEIHAGRIILYGAGRRGIQAYHTLKHRKNVSIVACVDKDFQNISAMPVSVGPLQEIRETEFDFILITPKDASVIKEIVETLLSMGVSGEKIV